MQRSQRLAENTPRFRPDHAFVVQFQNSEIAGHPHAGRIEHLESGRSQRFDSSAQLLEFFTAVLSSLDAGDGGQKE